MSSHNPIASTSTSSAPASSNPSLLLRAKRKLTPSTSPGSSRANSLNENNNNNNTDHSSSSTATSASHSSSTSKGFGIPKFLLPFGHGTGGGSAVTTQSEDAELSLEVEDGGHDDDFVRTRERSLAPPSHRENTPLHALLDSLPTLPAFSLRTLALPKTMALPKSLPPLLTGSLGQLGSSLGGLSLKRSPRPSVATGIFCRSPSVSDDDEVLGGNELAEEAVEDRAPSEHATSSPSSSTPPTSTTLDPLDNLQGNIVVLGGYRGSILRDAKTNKRLWIPLRVGFGLRKVDLSLGLSDEEEERSGETVKAGKMLMSVGGIIDLGKRLKDRLKALEISQGGLREGAGEREEEKSAGESGKKVVPLKFHNWGYDWRRRLELSSAELLRFLEGLKEESRARGEGIDGKGEGSTVIAHSMGGLVALHALSQATDPTIFKGIVFAGVPFQGCINVLSPLRRGDSVFFNREICSPRVVFSMRSSFYFLPRETLGACFETPSGKSLSLNFFDPQVWSDNALSPLTSGILAPDGVEKAEMRNRKRMEAERSRNHGFGAVVGGDPEFGEAEDTLLGEATERLRDLGVASGGGSENGTTPDRTSASSSPLVGRSRSGSMNEDSSNNGSRPGSGNFSHLGEKIRGYMHVGGHWASGGNASGTEGGAPIQPSKTGTDSELAEYLSRTLSRVKAFHESIITSYDPSKSHLYPPMTILTSHKTPTVRGVITDSYQTIPDDDYSLLLFGAGDGIVLYDSATELPGMWGNHLKKIVESKNGHVSLLGDLEAVRKSLKGLES